MIPSVIDLPFSSEKPGCFDVNLENNRLVFHRRQRPGLCTQVPGGRISVLLPGLYLILFFLIEIVYSFMFNWIIGTFRFISILCLCYLLYIPFLIFLTFFWIINIFLSFQFSLLNLLTAILLPSF